MESTRDAVHPFPATEPTPRWPIYAYGGWLVTGLVLAALLPITSLPRPILPALIWIPTLVFTALAWRSQVFARFASGLDLAKVIPLHAVRILAALAFIYFSRKGQLTWEFTNVAAAGDILAGAWALLAAWQTRRAGGVSRAVLLWNVVGLVDILIVFANAQRILFFGKGMAALPAMGTFPMPLIPMVVVPFILQSHFLVFWRYRRAQKEAEAS